MDILEIIMIVVIVLGVLFALLFWLNKKAAEKMSVQQNLIERSKQLTSIFVIDKKHSKLKEINMPKVVSENIPKFYKFMKMYFVQAKIGPQIMTLMCDKKVYNAIPTKKNVKVELAGIYIVSVVGMKSDAELKEMKKQKKLKAKENKKNK